MPTLPILFPMPIFKPTGNNGELLPGGKLYSYRAGTSTFLTTYDDTGAANGQPVTLDMNGQAHVRLGNQAYKLDLFDANNVRILGWPIDNITVSPVFPYGTATLLSSNGAAQLITPTIIPQGDPVLVVSTKITATFGNSNGLTAIAIGDGTITDRWGIQTILNAGAISGSSDSFNAFVRDGNLPRYPAPQRIYLTAIGGRFDNNGAIEVSAQYFHFVHTM